MRPRLPWAISALLCAVGCSDADAPAPRLDLIGAERPPKIAAGPGDGAKAHPPDARALHAEVFVVDLIQDHLFRSRRDGWTLLTPEAHTSLDRIDAGGVDLVLSAIPLEGGADPAAALEAGIADVTRLVAQTEGKAAIVASVAKARELRGRGVLPFAMLAEGADGLEGSTSDDLAALKRRGLVAIGLTGPRGNAFADSAVAPREHGGLTEKGAALVSACRDNGILVDLTHASPTAFWDALAGQGSLVAVTHSAARAVFEHPRNLDDLQIIALSRSGGVAGLVFNPELLAPERSTTGIAELLAHVAHFRALRATNALALGTDFGGVRPPEGLADVSALPRFTEALVAAGLSRDGIEGILGENALTLLEAVEAGQSAAEAGRDEPLRPIAVECDAVFGPSEGLLARTCDGYVIAAGPTLGPATRQRLRLAEVSRIPVRVELFGEPGTPWQVEAQDLDGKVLMRRAVALDENGEGTLPLPAGRGLTRLFVSPTRRTVLREVVVWGR